MIVELVKRNGNYFLVVLGEKILLTQKQQDKVEMILHMPKQEEEEEDD